MDNQEIEQFVIQKGCYEVANYFRDLFMNKRIEGKVAVVVEDYTTSFFFMPCDKYGYPKINEQRYLSFLDNNVNLVKESLDPTISMCKVTEKTIRVERPLVFQHISYNYPTETFIFLWEGRMVNSREVPLDELDIKKLMKLTQEAIQNREGIIIDEVLKNKLIK